jgi:VWFA-related protein
MPGASGLPGSDAIPDEITRNLDKLYGEADDFAKSMAVRTGGRVFQADTIASVNSAFAAIAEELRNQYLVGYYTRGSGERGKFHKIKVEVNGKGLVVRARSGYSEQ